MACITNRSSFRVIISNQLSSVNVSSYGFLLTKIKQVSFFENSAWTKLFYFYGQIFCIKH